MEALSVGDAGHRPAGPVDVVEPAVGRRVAPDWDRLLRDVLATGDQPRLVAQPIAQIGGGLVVGYEMLSRFTGPPDAPPDRWFAEADRQGYGPALTVRAVERAMLARRHLPHGTFLSINVHAHLLVHPAVSEALLDWGRLDRVVVELTGSTAVPDPRQLREMLDRVRGAGGRIAVDDTGVGDAALRRLLMLRPDIIRLGGRLLRGVEQDSGRRDLVRGLADVGRRMDAQVLAGGVETSGELLTLATLGVPLVQGWLLGRPAARWPRLESAVVPVLRRATHRSR